MLWERPPHDFTKASVLVLTKHARKIAMHLTPEKTSLHTLPIGQFYDADNYSIALLWANALWAKPMINRRTGPGWQGCQSTTTARKNTAGSGPFMAGQSNETGVFVHRLLNELDETHGKLAFNEFDETHDASAYLYSGRTNASFHPSHFC